MNKAIFYHAGCPICVDAESQMLNAIDTARYTVDIVHLGEQPDKIHDAAAAGVVSVPALLIDENVFHINYGASLLELQGEGQ